ncbi:thioesterase family protein [Erythrobacter sp. SDW2]|uniref:acyl-CoA thioesterase n=1 Tax=Erythrobacter sp. SDW2 TaxID=2907154 RepID=UPI001F3A2440|nr:thioesterase family protein [Erythrobacter sp. SDW2]UIP06741.1 thioesterase family protein [Erythrobacter sp. SDW2]
MSIAALLAPITAEGGPVTLPAEGWMQGRTLYGGAGALVAYTAATRAFPDLPPLRSAQVGFVGPVGTEIATRVEMVRQGRNVAIVRSELLVEGSVGLTALWVFGTEREPNAVHPAPKVEPWPGAPEEYESLPVPPGNHFIARYDIRRAQDTSGPGAPLVRRWFRLREPEALDPVSTMILMGDTLPPGSMRAMQRQGPFSSINWSFNVLDPVATTRDGWWLAETASDHADHGYSSERLRLWNAGGQQVLAGQQAMAIFG